MNQINLSTAVDEIKQACTDKINDPNNTLTRSSFFFLVGAGISHPPIPLANQIEDECKKIVSEKGQVIAPEFNEGDHRLDEYSFWFRNAFPHLIGRQKFLRDLIEPEYISQSNFRLAHLLLSNKLSSIVVTPNFDDLLTKALKLFGKSPIICDDPRTAERIDPERQDIQVVHVHGTYWYYDCRNLNSEIAERAMGSLYTTATMASLLDKLLSYRSPLVIGYSGWSTDVIMAALERRLRSRLQYNLYWFCHTKSELDQLPEWLTSHLDVYFVVPEERTSDPNEGTHNEQSTKEQTEKQLSETHSDDGESAESRGPEMSAQSVFDAIIKAFNLESPDLTLNPLKFFADSLRDSLPKDGKLESEGAPYFFGSVIARLEKAKETDNEASRSMEQVRDAIRRSQYGEAALHLSRIQPDDLITDDLIELMTLAKSISAHLTQKSPEHVTFSNAAGRLADTLLKRDSDDISTLDLSAWGLLCRANWLAEDVKYMQTSNSYCDAIIKRFEPVDDSDLRQHVVSAYMRKALNQIALKKVVEAIAIYDQVIAKYSNDKGITVQRQVANCYALKAAQQKTLNDYTSALTTYNNFIKEFTSSPDATIQSQLKQIAILKAQAAAEVEHPQPAAPATQPAAPATQPAAPATQPAAPATQPAAPATQPAAPATQPAAPATQPAAPAVPQKEAAEKPSTEKPHPENATQADEENKAKNDESRSTSDEKPED